MQTQGLWPEVQRHYEALQAAALTKDEGGMSNALARIRDVLAATAARRIRVYATTSFEGMHRWSEAPVEVSFLRHPHRHVFKVRVEVQVSHENRDVEFIMLKRKVDEEIGLIQVEEDTGHWSCERWALELLQRLQAERVEVSEDGENGAIVEL